MLTVQTYSAAQVSSAMPILMLDIHVGHVLLFFLSVEKTPSAAQASSAKALLISARNVVLLEINVLLHLLLATQDSPALTMAVVECASQSHAAMKMSSVVVQNLAAQVSPAMSIVICASHVFCLVLRVVKMMKT